MTRLSSLGSQSRLVGCDVLRRALSSAVVQRDKMLSLDWFVPQATQLPLQNRTVDMVVLGEGDLPRLQHTSGFKNLRDVHYIELVVRSARVEPQNLLAVDGIAASWPAPQLTPGKSIRRSKRTSADEATKAQLRHPPKEDA
jgi:hypothetical protein